MRKSFLLISIYLLVWLVFAETKVFNQTDSLWSIYTTVSLVQDGNLDLDEYSELFQQAFYANLTYANGHTYNYYPYGVSILAAPYVWLLDKWYSRKEKNLKDKILLSSTIKLEKTISSSLLAFSACIFFLLSLRLTTSTSRAILCVFSFSFCTLVFSTVSRGLWQHSGSILLLSLSLYSFTLKKKSFLILTAIPLFFTYIVRPTNILPVFFLSLFAIYQLKKKSIYFFLLGFLVLGVFFYINQTVFGSVVHPYYDFRKVSGSGTFYEALAGNLLSPGRGLFVYSPIFFFSFLGVVFKRKFESLIGLDYALFSIIILHWILISRNLNWWGGHSYGYRLLSDMIPFFMYYLIFFIKYVSKKSFIFGIFLLAVIVSFYMNFKGAQYMETYLWNLIPNNIDQNSDRNWDWMDAPFLR